MIDFINKKAEYHTKLAKEHLKDKNQAVFIKHTVIVEILLILNEYNLFYTTLNKGEVK